MKSIFLSISLFVCTLLQAQTQGTLSFSFTQTAHTSYTGSKNVMAVWIQSSTGTFIQTRMRYAGGGATLTSFGTRTLTWDGTDASGNIVADGTYKVTIESCWNHGTSAKTTRSFTFTKGSAADVQTPADDANFTGIALAWNPSGAGVNETANDIIVSIHPNPSSNGVFTVDFNYAMRVSALNLAGEEVYTEDIKMNENSKIVNLSNMPNGVYFICVENGTSISKHKVVINK
jgi:hypothetical protein